jgi:hypothetical protein
MINDKSGRYTKLAFLNYLPAHFIREISERREILSEQTVHDMIRSGCLQNVSQKCLVVVSVRKLSADNYVQTKPFSHVPFQIFSLS